MRPVSGRAVPGAEETDMQRWRKLLMAGGALAALLASPAFADGEITASTLQTKTITVTETINFDVQVDSELTVVLEPQKFAESLAVANQSNFGNKACENCAEKQDIIIDSASDNTGILSINQASGNANNQGTLFSAAVDVALPGFDEPRRRMRRRLSQASLDLPKLRPPSINVMARRRQLGWRAKAISSTRLTSCSVTPPYLVRSTAIRG
jgi:hypothetical protein